MKVLKTIFALVLVAAFVAVGVWGYPRVAARFTWVAIAAINLSPGMPIRDGMAILKLWRVDQIPEGAVHSLQNIIGNYARERIAKGEIVRPSAVTTKTPPPVRTMPRWGYSIICFGVPRDDAAKLFVGDRVDITITFVDKKTNQVMEPKTFKVGWPVHHIDYEDPVRGTVVRVEVKNEELNATLGYGIGHPKYETNPSLPQRSPSRMVLSAPREE